MPNKFLSENEMAREAGRELRALEAALAAEQKKVRKLRDALKYYGKCSGDGCWCRRGGEGHRTARLALIEISDKEG